MKINRAEVYKKYNGKCAYCGKEIEIKDMQVDHLIPQCEAKYGEISADDVSNIENLMPSCRRCNHYKRANRLETFRRYLLEMKEKVLGTYLGKVAVDYGMVEWKGWDGEFYFEKCEKREAENE